MCSLETNLMWFPLFSAYARVMEMLMIRRLVRENLLVGRERGDRRERLRSFWRVW
jgi:hypothetical protein